MGKHVIERPVTIIMCALALVMIGAVSVMRLPISFMPDNMGFPGMSVFVPLPDAAPHEHERAYTDPLEQEIKTVNGLYQLNTHTTRNQIRVFMQFDRDADMDEAYMQVRDRLERARAFLPQNLTNIPIQRFRGIGDSEMTLRVSWEPSVEDPGYLMQRKLKPWLERLPGVAKVDIFWPEKELRIRFNPDRVRQMNLDLGEVMRQIREARTLKNLGVLRDGEHQVSVKIPPYLSEIAAWADFPVRPGVRLRDIATVSLEPPETDRETRWNGNTIAAANVFKMEGTSAVTLSRTVNGAVVDLPGDLSAFQVEALWDKGGAIADSIDQLVMSGLIGAVFAFIVIYFFVHRLDLAVIVAAAVPLSLLSAMTWQYFTGGTLNMMSMVGFMMAIGMLVDNAVVVVEQIDFRMKTEGEVVPAILKAMGEIMQPMIIATSTTMVVLLPLIALDMGLASVFLRGIAVPLCVSLFASLVFATTLTPLLVRFALARKKREWSIFGLFERVVSGFTDFYIRMMRAGLQRRALLIFTLLVGMTLAGSMAFRLDFNLEGEPENRVEIDYLFPRSTTMEEVKAFADEVEAVLKPRLEELKTRGIQTRILSNFDVRFDLWLDFNRYPDARRGDVATMLNGILPESPPGGQLSINHTGAGQEDSGTPITISGRSPDAVLAYAEELRGLLLADERVLGVDTGEGAFVDEVLLKLNRDRLARAGLSSRQAAMEMQNNFQERTITRVITPRREYDIKVSRDDLEEQTVQDIALLPLGDNPSMAAFADLEVSRGLGSISKKDGRILTEVKISTTLPTSWEASRFVREFVAQLNPPEGLSVTAGSARFRFSTDQADLVTALIATFICVYILMAFLYESLAAPFAVIVAVPIAFIGAIGLIFFTGRETNAMSSLAFILLIGVVVNNAVLLVNRLLEAQRAGAAFADASEAAVRERLRPIMMASMTTILGLTPLAFGDANMLGIQYAPLGKVFVGGMALSTLLVPFFVPICLSLLQDLSRYVTGVRNWFVGRTSPRMESAEQAP
ncbi:MAG: efflux RND transporter permease subunit [Acidobacteriota bacterium]|nr:efflux RND transporter permease subunit [Acidobacteriota bacterium]